MTELTEADIEEWVAQAYDAAERDAEAYRYARLAPELQRIYYNARDAGDLDHEEAVEMMEAALAECNDAEEEAS